LWVGCRVNIGTREVFRSVNTPTEESHPMFGAVFGPFRTRKGADFMASDAARNNPHCQCVADAERIANTGKAREPSKGG